MFPANKIRIQPKVESVKEEYLELGVPEEWVESLRKVGYTTIDKLNELEKQDKLANDLNGYRKKNKPHSSNGAFFVTWLSLNEYQIETKLWPP